MDRDNFNDENFENNDIYTGGDVSKTQEMDSLRIGFQNETHGITPRDEFTEMNSAEDMSRTLLMDPVAGEGGYDEPIPVNNPVKRRRRKKKKQTNHVRTMGQVFLGVVISVFAVVVGSVLAFQAIQALRDLTGMSKESKEFDISITEDTTIDDIIAQLGNNGILLKPTFFKSYIKWTDEGEGFLVGTHTVRSNMSYGSILTALRSIKHYTATTVTIMFPEGLTALEVGKRLEENKVCRAADFEKIYRGKLNEYDFEEGIPDNPNRLNMLEGYIWPDTYEFYVIDDLEKYPTMDTTEYAMTALTTMLNTFETKITRSLKERMEDLDMTLDEVITLASIIQREGSNEENFAIISSIFHNRLNDPVTFPHIQSDTTYTYINQCIRPAFSEDEAEKMEAVIAAYNTYECYGLPASAICNPGMDAIRAALYPDETDYYYFLVDKEGVFYYAQTLAQHEQNIIDAKLNEND